LNSANVNHQVVFVTQGTAELEARDIPNPGPNELLVRTRVSLISPGTERAFFLGLPNTSLTYPQYTGYSNVGEVASVGANVTAFAPGDRVICAGHHAAFVVVDVAKCLRIPDGISSSVTDEQASFFNLCSIALQGVRKARIELGESVAVIGAGLIGLLTMQMAKLNGGLPVLSIDRDPLRLDFARDAGADATLVAGENTLQQVAELCQAQGATIVIEATGVPEAVLTAFELTKPFGRVILLGSSRGETERVNFYHHVHRKGLTVIGAHFQARPYLQSAPGWWTELDDWRVVLNLLAQKRLQIEPLITHRFTWQDAPQAYALLKHWDHNALGIVLDWRA
jgi:L-iditol 2-dehydrogenase